MRDPEFQELDLDFYDGEPEGPGVKPDLWQRLSRVMEALLYLLVLAAAAKVFWPEVEHQRDLNAQLARIEQVRVSHEARVGQLKLEYDLLKNDQEYLETVARDRLDFSMPDEYIVRIQRRENPEDEELDPGNGE